MAVDWKSEFVPTELDPGDPEGVLTWLGNFVDSATNSSIFELPRGVVDFATQGGETRSSARFKITASVDGVAIGEAYLNVYGQL